LARPPATSASRITQPIRTTCAHPLAGDAEALDQEEQYYEIRVRGHLGETLLAAFPDLRAHAHGGETVLAGRLPDQAALHGVLAQIGTLALELLEVRRVLQSGAADADQPYRTTTAHPAGREPRPD
jgi:hypothetical protein